MLDDLPSLKDVLRHHGLTANKKLGQHFLLDQNVTDQIARLASPLNETHVMEVGPGPGGLTRSLLNAGAKRVLAVEMDDRFLEPLGAIQLAAPGRLDIELGDALKIDPRKFFGDDPIKIVANLPYNVGTKLLINWLTTKPLFWIQAVLMFQKEVAERVVARPGDSAYGRLAILSQSVCECNLAFTVPARAFSPPPKVDSAVVVLNPKPITDRFENLKLLGELTQAAFGQRRKMLRRSLRNFAAKYELDLESWLGTCGIDSQRRPETVTVVEFQALAAAIIRSDQA